MTKSCQTCANHIGGGMCRAGLEHDCAAGEYEAWELVTRFASMADALSYLKVIDAESDFHAWCDQGEYRLEVYSV